MSAVKVIFLFALVAGILATKDPNGHCQLKAKGESKKVCNGAIGKDMGKFVKICLNGILKIKKKASVEPAAPQCQNEEGEVFCEGDVVEEKTCNQQMGVYKEICINGTTVKDPEPCEVGEDMFCHGDVVEEKMCSEEENYMKKCENGTLGWKKESVSGSPLKESCDPCPSCELEGNLYCDTEVVQEKNCGEGGYSQVCSKGDLVWENSDPSSSLPEPCDSPNPCPCRWYGEYFCDGDLVKDLFSWWFHMKCSSGTPRVNGRLWNEVIQDERFKP